MVREDPELCRFAMGLKKQGFTARVKSPLKNATTNLHLETQMTNRGLLNDQIITEMTPNREEIYDINLI